MNTYSKITENLGDNNTINVYNCGCGNKGSKTTNKTIDKIKKGDTPKNGNNIVIRKRPVK